MGFTEMLVIGVVALIAIGPKQLPEVAKVLGRLISEFKKATQDLSGGLLEVTQEVRETLDETKQDIVNEAHKMKDSMMSIPVDADTKATEEDQGSDDDK